MAKAKTAAAPVLNAPPVLRLIPGGLPMTPRHRVPGAPIEEFRRAMSLVVPVTPEEKMWRSMCLLAQGCCEMRDGGIRPPKEIKIWRRKLLIYVRFLEMLLDGGEESVNGSDIERFRRLMED